MYIHLGGDTIVLQKDIIGIFDLDTATVSKHTRDYLAKAEKNGEVITVTYELPKSFVVCRSDKGKRIYLSQLSTATLLKRKNLIFK